jgi:hypothetical protein
MTFKLTSPRIQHEFFDQAAVIRWRDLNLKRTPDVRWLFSTLSGVPLRPAQARRMKLSGLVAGLPDLWLPVRRDPFCGLAVELKHGKNVPTDEQWNWLRFLTSQGWYTSVAYGHEAAINIIADYLDSKCDRAMSVMEG